MTTKDEAKTESIPKYAWVNRFMNPVDYKCEEDDQAAQAVELYKDYMNMVEGRKKRHTERELCRLWWAWIVLRRRHERRVRTSKMETVISWKRTAKATASTPPRKQIRQPESPSNPIEELRMARKANRIEEHNKQMKIACLKRRKVNLERWFHLKMIKQHKIGFQKVLTEVEKGRTPRQIKKINKKNKKKRKKKKQKKEKRYKTVEEAAFWEDWEGWESDEMEIYQEEIEDQLIEWIEWCNSDVEAEGYDCLDNNQPAVTTTEAPKKQYTDMERKYIKIMTAAQRAITEATIAVETPFYWFRDETMDEVDNNHYFWHRGRPPEGDY
jgi:hypothetical protein